MTKRLASAGLVSVAFAVIAAACGGRTSAAAGELRGACYGNGTCNAGLTCLSDVCVVAPGGDGGSGSSGGGSSSGSESSSSGSASSSSGSSSGADASCPSGCPFGVCKDGTCTSTCSVTCPGCCDAREQCQMGTANLNCGTGGVVCADCSATIGATCMGGVCTGGPGDANCSSTCMGCCDENDVCHMGVVDTACGTGGLTCSNCTLIDGGTCSNGESCAAPCPPCGPGQQCFDGSCVTPG
jgi:hypothetical protein